MRTIAKRTTSGERVAKFGFDPHRPDLEEVEFGLLLANRTLGAIPYLADGECWVYQGRNRRAGNYSFVTVCGLSMPVHRAVYALHHPEAPWPEHVHHRCERRECVRIEHLVGMTAVEHAREHAETVREAR